LEEANHTVSRGLKNMTKKTKSELHFEKFCADHSLELFSVPRKSDDKEKTPDYILQVGEQKIIVEIKQLNPNPTDQKHLKDFENYGETGFVLGGFDRRVRKKIKKSVPQLKTRSKGKHPGILVLYDNVHIYGGIDGYDIRVGMYGQETIDVAISKARRYKPFAIRHRFGAKRSLDKSHNTSLSCAAVLIEHPLNGLKLNIYHNDFASIPLIPDLLRLPQIRHFRLEESITTGAFRNWIEC
jgi:hypothetical protein